MSGGVPIDQPPEGRGDRLATLRIVLIWGTIVGLAAFVVSSVLVGYLQFHQTQQLTQGHFLSGPGSLATASIFVETVSRAIWVGCLAGLVLMWLVRAGSSSDAPDGS